MIDSQKLFETHQKAHRLLGEARDRFVEIAAPKLTPEQQLALYQRVAKDPALVNEVIRRYGIEGFRRWQETMLAMEKDQAKEGE